MGISSVYIMPHAPIFIPEIGGVRGKSSITTTYSCQRIGGEIWEEKPDTIILSSPHAPNFHDFALINQDPILAGDFANFGHDQIQLNFQNDLELSQAILEVAQAKKISILPKTSSSRDLKKKPYLNLDHGSTVPLYFVDQAYKDKKGLKSGKPKLVIISTPFARSHDLYLLGQAIGEACMKLDRKCVYIASGDLSHRLTYDAPAAYSPKGREYDLRIKKYLEEVDVDSMLAISEYEMEEAGECGTRSFIMGLGVLDGREITSKIYSYEGPFGVGYMCGKLSGEIGAGNEKDLSGTKENLKKTSPESGTLSEILAKVAEEGKVYPGLARYTIKNFIRNNKTTSLDDFLALPLDFLIKTEAKGLAIADVPGVKGMLLNKKAASFVTIYKRGNLRGCIGTIYPARENVFDEIVHNAISAATQDPRFSPVRDDELEGLDISVDLLGPVSPVHSREELDELRYGVIVSKGYRRGLLLPNLDGVDSVEEQIQIALSKAGISPAEEYDLEKFEVIRYL